MGVSRAAHTVSDWRGDRSRLLGGYIHPPGLSNLQFCLFPAEFRVPSPPPPRNSEMVGMP